MTLPAIPLWPDSTGLMEGGRLCLAFANTAWWRRSGDPTDSLSDYASLLTAVGTDFDTSDRDGLRAAAAADPDAAARAFSRAIALREAVYRLFLAIADGTAPAPGDLAEVDRWAGKAFGQLRLASPAGGAAPTTEIGVGWRRPVHLDRPAWQVALSAVALLGTGPLERIKACPGPRCGWLFLDLTRNDSRRWCSPAHCGNRERVKAHYRRTHGGTPATAP